MKILPLELTPGIKLNTTKILDSLKRYVVHGYPGKKCFVLIMQITSFCLLEPDRMQGEANYETPLQNQRAE